MSLYYTEKDQVAYEASLREVHFHSKLGFLNSTNGLRRGSLHLLVAGTGGGKSTIVRTLIRDLLFHPQNNPVLGLWLSEETVEEYKQMLSKGMPSHSRLLNAEAASEQENRDMVFEKTFFEWADLFKPHVLIFDNITTSKFYEGKTPKEQGEFASKLKNIIKRINCAGVIIAHADSQQTMQKGGMLDINNIRGAKTICNLAEFAYTVQTFSTPKQKHTILRVVKSRSQDIIHDTFSLNYSPITSSYINDTAIPFEKFKESYNARNRL